MCIRCLGALLAPTPWKPIAADPDILKMSKLIVIGENKKYAFYFMGEKYRHFGQPNTRNLVASFIMKSCLTVPEIRSKQGSGQKSEMSHNGAKIKVSAWLHFSQEAFRDNPLPCSFQFLEIAQST